MRPCNGHRFDGSEDDIKFHSNKPNEFAGLLPDFLEKKPPHAEGLLSAPHTNRAPR
jgi:hypothetical protein